MQIRQVILDTETTGLSPLEDRIIEIGCLEMISRRLTGRKFHVYLNPQRAISAGAQQVHGISNAFLADKPTFDTIAQELKAFIQGAELVIHNAPFDLAFLDNELMRMNDEWKNITEYCTVLDTLLMARKMHPGQKNNLDALCKRYNVNNAHRKVHGALLDAEILADLYLIMTGGQTVLDFSIDTLDNPSALNTLYMNLPIIKANREELKVHQQFLINEGLVNLIE